MSMNNLDSTFTLVYNKAEETNRNSMRLRPSRKQLKRKTA